jgi:hypothetical protein
MSQERELKKIITILYFFSRLFITRQRAINTCSKAVTTLASSKNASEPIKKT